MLTRLFTSISNVLDINVATMSGCNDIIVIPHLDGSLKSTPFHVRFGKSKILRSRQRKVSITVNGQSTNVHMYLDASGGAYFRVAPKATKYLDSSSDLDSIPFTFQLHKSSNRATEPLHYPLRFSNSDVEQPYSQNVGLCSTRDPRSIKSSHTLRPTSDQLKSFHLQLGYNLVEFSVQSYFQGKQTVRGSIYFWKPTVKIIVSDIDGTITKSDVIGQLSPILKKDWSHMGVAALFSACKKNNYKILYLSSRSIGQTDVTRDYLFGLRQGKSCEVLPDGPIILNPNRLVSSFLVEVVKREAYVFKTSVLKDLKSLFPSFAEPFYAGFGNRITDMISYKAIGIPESRRYIVDTKGVVHNSLKGTESNTYATLHKSIDIAFPPVQCDSSDEVLEQLVLSNKRINKNVFYGFTQSRLTKNHYNILCMNSMNKSPFLSCSRVQRTNSFY